MVSRSKLKEYVTYFLLTVVYLFCSFRYFPGRRLDTLLETVEHVASIGPYTIGATLVIASVLRKMSGEQLPWKSVIRIFLAVSIILELVLGIANYVDPKQSAAGIILFIG